MTALLDCLFPQLRPTCAQQLISVEMCIRAYFPSECAKLIAEFSWWYFTTTEDGKHVNLLHREMGLLLNRTCWLPCNFTEGDRLFFGCFQPYITQIEVCLYLEDNPTDIPAFIEQFPNLTKVIVNGPARDKTKATQFLKILQASKKIKELALRRFPKNNEPSDAAILFNNFPIKK